MTVGGKVVEDVDMPVGVPHNFMITADVDGNDIWVGHGEGPRLGHRRRLLPGMKERPLYAYGATGPERRRGQRAPDGAGSLPAGRPA